jgi:hypothetical protein
MRPMKPACSLNQMAPSGGPGDIAQAAVGCHVSEQPDPAIGADVADLAGSEVGKPDRCALTCGERVDIAHRAAHRERRSRAAEGGIQVDEHA